MPSMLGHGGLDPCVQRIEYGRDVGDGEWLAFRAKRRELIGAQRAAAGVREEAIDDSRDVPHVKRRRCHAGGPGVPLRLRQMFDEFADAFANVEEDVRHRLQDGGDAVHGTSLPPLGIRHGCLVFTVVQDSELRDSAVV